MIGEGKALKTIEEELCYVGIPLSQSEMQEIRKNEEESVECLRYVIKEYERLKEKEIRINAIKDDGVFICPKCNFIVGQVDRYCRQCGQRVKGGHLLDAAEESKDE